MILTYKYRIKDKNTRKRLCRYAWAANQVWNYCCAYQRDIENRYRAGAPKRKWPSHFGLTYQTAGTSKELGIRSDTISEVCRVFAASRDKLRHSPGFRASGGPRRALGWVPFRVRGPKLAGNSIFYAGESVRVWLGGRPFPDKIKSGEFIEDTLGRWFVCLRVEVDDLPTGTEQVGIDLGLKALATCSDGTAIEAPRIYRRHEHRLAIAQRAGNKRRARALNAKIRNCRRDFLHKATTKLVRESALIAVGNVSSSKLVKTRMAKSVLDAGWSMFKTQLRYKASRHGAVYLDVDEKFTTQACSSCGTIPDSSPKGMGALGIRAWDCSECGESHNRDVNAAQNILMLALRAQRLVGDSPEAGIGPRRRIREAELVSLKVKGEGV